MCVGLFVCARSTQACVIHKKIFIYTNKQQIVFILANNDIAWFVSCLHGYSCL
jgi:hypothetical protein